MGIRSTRPLPLAHAELAMAPFFRRRFRSWQLAHVRLALQRYRLLTTRGCVDALQLSAILGLKDKKLVDDVLRLFLPRTPTRVQCMVDVMEVLIALALVCQAPGMLQRFELIFEVVDVEKKGAISTTDLILLFGAVGRAVMKLFEYKVEPEQHAAMAYVTEVLDSLDVGRNGSIAKEMLCKFMLSDRSAVHYVKQCTGEDKHKLYVMMEKDTEFLGAVEFSNEQHMQTTSLRNVRDMIYAQVQRVPDDFTFLCQGHEVEKVWEVDRRAWSIVPFALRGSPGLRATIMAKNRKIERPAVANPFEFRYMGNRIGRYKKYVHDIKPVYTHRAFRLRKNEPRKRLEPVLQWRVATTWSGEWLYKQQLIKTHLKSHILKSLRTAVRPPPGVLMVKSHFGELLSPCSMITARDDNETEDRPPSPTDYMSLTPPKSEQRMQRISAMNLRERKHEKRLLKQRIQWKARIIAMEAQHQMEKITFQAAKEGQHAALKKSKDVLDSSTTSSINVLVHLEEDNSLPSRLIQCKPKKRRRPKKLEWSMYQWDIPGRMLSALPPRRKKLKVTKISDGISLTAPSGTSTNQQTELGTFLSSTSIYLDDNEVEAFPVLIIRPIEEQICVKYRVDDMIEDVLMQSISSADADTAEKGEKKLLCASKTYLTEFEYDISATESNFEALYQHIASGNLQDAIWLNRRDVFGRTMLHDAAEFGHTNIMELLLKARVFLDTQDARGDTALHHAARHGRLKEVSMILREHATPWLLNFEGKSPLYCALETAAKRSSQSASRTERKGSELLLDPKPADDRKNFFLAHRTYPQLRQVIDLLWDNYKLSNLVTRDVYDRTSCVELEKQVYGDLVEACHDGNLLRVQRLIDLDKRPVLRYINDQMEFLRRTALHEATEQGHTATVDFLLKLGADGYLRDQRLQAPLHVAACKGYDKIVKCLISKFPQILAYQDINGCTPLHLAIQWKQWGIATELISLAKSIGNEVYHEPNAGVSFEGQRVNCLDLQDIHGYTALHYACIHGNLEVCTALINADAAVYISRCRYRIPKGTSHLLGRWWKGDLKKIGNRKRLLESSDQCETIDIEAPAEMLLKGCKENFLNYQERLSILELLLVHEYGVDYGSGISALVKISPSPLFHLAAEISDVNISVAVEVCRRLHKLGIEINMTHPKTGETVLLKECKRICLLAKQEFESGVSRTDEMSSPLALIRSLLELGANADLANEFNGESPLGCATWYGHLALLDLLLEAGADKNGFLRRCSFSPLHFAALGNNVACAKLLISHSATVNVEMPPTNAETPLYFAIRSKSEEMVELLLCSNADPCSLCTVQHNRVTSFNATLSLHVLTDSTGRGSDSTEQGSCRASPSVASPLTFGLLVAQSLKAFGVPEQLSCSIERTQKRMEWEQMERICSLLAKRLLEDNGGSKGVVTRDDVHLACVLGFWKLVQVLLSQQVTLSSAPSAVSMNALHLAASAGQTRVVTALVAGGMNVNCFTRSESPKPKRTAWSRRTWYEWNGCGHRGALFYALIHGHVQTASKLLVLGADAEQTIPHSLKKIMWRISKGEHGDSSFREHIAVRFVVNGAMKQSAKTEYLETKKISNRQHESIYNQKKQVDGASVNLIHLIECCINQKVPLLHLAVAVGHLTVVRVLIEAGMSIFSGFASPPKYLSGLAGLNYPAETPIHLAIACGYLEIVQHFASIVQNHFPGCFVREGKNFKSLLVTACETHQVLILRFLLRHDSVSDGGGFTYDACKEEFQSALSVCATVQFVEGFELLIQYGAMPDAHTLVSALQGITLQSKHSMASPIVNAIELLEREEVNWCASFPGERSKTNSGANSVEVATKLLTKILPPESSRDISDFIGASPILDVVLKILIVSSRYQLWFVLNQIFVQHQEYFMDAASIWKTVVVRAANSSLVLHRAAMQNQVQLVAFLLRLGVPAELQLGRARCPIWYAASRGSLESFMCLALRSPSFVDDCLAFRWSTPDGNFQHSRKLNALTLVFRSIEESRSILTTSNATCRWQNLGVFGCVGMPKRHTNWYLIQKFINYGIQIACGHVDNSLLHHASRRGELLAVQSLVEAGADLFTINRMGESPLEVASSRKDSFGLSVVRYLLSAMKQNKIQAAANIIDRALVCCFAQETPCNLMIAQALLDEGADTKFYREATEDEKNACGFAKTSAISCAMQTAQLAGVSLLLDKGAVVTVPLSEAFLARFLMDGACPTKRHWRRFSAFVKHNGGRKLLLDVEGIMQILLTKTIFAVAMNSDLVHQILTSASALAATVAQEVELSKQFWGIVNLTLEEYPKEVSSRNTEWSGKSALHYAVATMELPTVIKLLALRGLDMLAQDENKQTPLHLAAAGGDEEICRLLLSKLQSNTAQTTAIDVPDARGRTALHLAVIHGHESAAIMLLAAGASLDVRCRDGLTALLYAAKCNRLAILIALHSQAPMKSHDALFSVNGDAGIFVAARHGAFPVVRWFMNLYDDEEHNADEHTSSSKRNNLLFGMQCCSGRSVLHYSAIYGDEETLKLLLKAGNNEAQTESSHAGASVETFVNSRDQLGYTPLMYAFAFGRLRVVRVLCELGADPYTSVDHSGDPGAHPYTVGFDIAGLLQWFALPGWYSFSCKNLPTEEKSRLVRTTTIDEDYLWNSSYNYRTKRKPPIEWRCKWKQIPAGRLLKAEPVRRGRELIRTSIRSWRFPRKTIFDYACEIGNAQVVDFLAKLHLPQVFRSLTYQAQRCNFMQAVRWNRLDIVKSLAASSAPGNALIEVTTGNHFLDFLEAGIECAISRGLEDMAIYLVSRWQGIKENSEESATPSAFAFQFAPAFQIACIRRLSRLVECMIARGGEHIVEYHCNEGPALVYAFAFGRKDIADLLLRNGADPSFPTGTYSVASLRKWVEFGSPKDVRVLWQSRIASDEGNSKRPAFIGPIDSYEMCEPRLPIDDLCRIFSGISFSGTCSGALDNSGDAAPLESTAVSVQSEQLADAVAALKVVDSENDLPQEDGGISADVDRPTESEAANESGGTLAPDNSDANLTEATENLHKSVQPGDFNAPSDRNKDDEVRRTEDSIDPGEAASSE